MSLSQYLLEQPLRETTGSLTQSRFDFQTYWGLALICREHLSGDNYAVLFEFHDDIVLLNDHSFPTSADFFQIKGKSSGHWSLADLKYRKKKGGTKKVMEKEEYLSSILGKMFDNIDKFDEFVSSVSFVSNASCGLNMSGQKYQFADCNPKDYEKVAAAVRSEFPKATDAQIKLMGFEKTDLSLNDPVVHAKGKFHELVTLNLGPTEFDLETMFKAVASECRKKSIFTEQVKNFDDLVQSNGVSRLDVESWLTN